MNTKATTIIQALLFWLAGLGLCAAQTNSIDRFQVSGNPSAAQPPETLNHLSQPLDASHQVE